MKKNVNSVLIGKKVSRKQIILPFVLLSILGIMAGRGLYYIIIKYGLVSSSFALILAFIMYLGVAFLLLPATLNAENILFSDEYVCYYRITGYLNKFNELFRILFKLEEKPTIIVKTSDILRIKLSYLKYTGPRGLIGYRLKMTFFLKNDKSFYVFPVTEGQMENGDFEKAFALLERNNVEILDEFRLRTYLIQGSSAFQKYAELIDKNKNI